MASPVSHPLISVIVPAYNVGEKLEETLRSLAGQGPKDDSRFEFLIVDDGSRDNTLEVAKAFAATDPRFKVLHQRNRGCGPGATPVSMPRQATGSGSWTVTIS